MTQPDRALLEKAVAGDTDALTALLKQHGPAVRARISPRIPSRWQSLLSDDDVMQQTYAEAFLGIGQFDPDRTGSFSTWLTRLAECNLSDAIRMLEAAKRGGRAQRVKVENAPDAETTLVAVLSGTGTSPSGLASGQEARRLLAEAMASLPATYRAVVQMYDLEGHDVEAVARVLNRSPGAVYMIRARAHDRLRTLLGATADFFTDGA